MTPNERYMRRAIELSSKGLPAPNPHVGCVIVRDDQIVGEGFHDHAGGPHAEVVALEKAGQNAKGADVYVTLEPCNHAGKTPPCTLALIKSNVKSVTFACADPNSRATGGAKALESAGIQVSSGLLQNEARSANERFLVAMERGMPFVEAKVAMSLDGRVALSSGESKWITGEQSREHGHYLRAKCGAVLVGRKTVQIDDPMLTARIPGVVNQPVRIVLDPERKLSGKEKVFDGAAPTWRVVKTVQSDRDIQASFVDGEIDLKHMLKQLFEKGVISLLIEGGPHTLSAALRQQIIDRMHLFIAPKVLGNGPSWFESDLTQLQTACQFSLESMQQIGDDMHLCYRPAAR